MIITTWLVSTALAGTWVREPGHGYTNVAVGISTARHRFTEDGRRLPMDDDHFVPANFEATFDDASTQQLDVALYAEVGVLPELEVFGSLPVRRSVARWPFAASDDVLTLANTGLGDATLGVRWGRPVGSAVTALAAAVRLPLYDNALEALGLEPGNADLYDDQPPLGAGTVDVDLLASVGGGFARGWLQAEAGVRLRNRRFGAQVPVRVQGGLRPAPALAVFAELEALAALIDGQAPDDYLDAYNKGPLALDRQSHLRPGVGLLVEPWASSEGAQPGALLRVDRVLSGRRTAATTTVTAGVQLAW
ncbi:MAG: hypothetical protein KTR31_30170 [Myxococcales bacterium]|nr:hypothetical protein [Myxococcales bacterium]